MIKITFWRYAGVGLLGAKMLMPISCTKIAEPTEPAQYDAAALAKAEKPLEEKVGTGNSPPKKEIKPYSREELDYLTQAVLYSGAMQTEIEKVQQNKKKMKEEEIAKSSRKINYLLNLSKVTLDVLLSKYSSNELGHTLRGQLYDYVKRFQEAREDYKRGGKPGAIYLAYHYLAENKMDEAIAALEEALRTESSQPSVRYMIGIRIDGRFVKEKDATPDEAIETLLIKLCYERDQDFEEAKRALRRILKFDDPASFEKKCRALLAKGGLTTHLGFEHLLEREKPGRKPARVLH